MSALNKSGRRKIATRALLLRQFRLIVTCGYLLRRWHELDATIFSSAPFVQLGNNLLYRPGHNIEIPLPVALDVVAASKRDHIAMPVGAFSPGRRP